MTSAERRRLLDAMPPDERLMFIRRCTTQLVLTPLGLCLMVFPFAMLGLFLLITKGIKVSEMQSASFVAGIAVLVAAGVCWLGCTRGRKLMDQMLEANNTRDAFHPPEDGTPKPSV